MPRKNDTKATAIGAGIAGAAVGAAVAGAAIALSDKNNRKKVVTAMKDMSIETKKTAGKLTKQYGKMREQGVGKMLQATKGGTQKKQTTKKTGK